MTKSYGNGESFTVEGPPMVWDTNASTFIIDDEAAEAQGWRTRVLPTGGVVWEKDLREGSDG